MSDETRCVSCGAVLEFSPCCGRNAALRAEVERLTREIDDALAVTRAPDSTNDGGRENVADEMRRVVHNWSDAESRASRLEAALRVYADPKNWQTPSTGFAAQYDPEPSVIQKGGNHAIAASALMEGK